MAIYEFDIYGRLEELENKTAEELTQDERNEIEWLKEKIEEIETEQKAWEKLYGDDE